MLVQGSSAVMSSQSDHSSVRDVWPKAPSLDRRSKRQELVHTWRTSTQRWIRTGIGSACTTSLKTRPSRTRRDATGYSKSAVSSSVSKTDTSSESTRSKASTRSPRAAITTGRSSLKARGSTKPHVLSADDRTEHLARHLRRHRAGLADDQTHRERGGDLLSGRVHIRRWENCIAPSASLVGRPTRSRSRPPNGRSSSSSYACSRTAE